MAAKDRRKGDRRLVDKTIFPEPERDPVLHSPEGCPDCFEPRDDPVVLTPNDRVVSRLQLHGGRLVDFHLGRQRLVEGDWLDVVSFDCRHDTVHMHEYDDRGQRSGRKVLRPIVTQQDVEAGHDEASETLYGQWEQELGGEGS